MLPTLLISQRDYMIVESNQKLEKTNDITIVASVSVLLATLDELKKAVSKLSEGEPDGNLQMARQGRKGDIMTTKRNYRLLLGGVFVCSIFVALVTVGFIAGFAAALINPSIPHAAGFVVFAIIYGTALWFIPPYIFKKLYPKESFACYINKNIHLVKP